MKRFITIITLEKKPTGRHFIIHTQIHCGIYLQEIKKCLKNVIFQTFISGT